MRFYKIPRWSKRVYRDAIWDFYFEDDRSIYLTFDDGPTEAYTDQILDLLKNENIPATFFCLGKNVELYPELFERIKKEGHAIGNHGYDHLNGFLSDTTCYIDNTSRGTEITQSKYFRPPYGKIKKAQYRALRSENHKVVFWSNMAYDFDQALSSRKRIHLLKKLVKPGSIIVFHDNNKAGENVLKELPELIKHWKSNQFTFKTVFKE